MQYAINGLARASLLLVATALLAAAASQTAPAARTSGGSVTANSVTFEDPVAEEDARAPDISTVVVSNDDAGLLSFEVHFANRAALGPGEELSLWFETDSNSQTGLSGFDRFIELIGSDLTLTDWESYDEVATTTLVAVAGPSSVTVRIRAKELGVASAFRFHVWADATPDDIDVTDVDTAPDQFWVGWSYEVKVAVPVLALSAVTCTPSPARSAKPVTARTTVTIVRGGVGEPLAADAKASWAAVVGGIRLKSRGSTAQPTGRLSSTWLLPKASKGKRVRISVVVTVENVTVTKTQSCRIA